MCHVCQYKFKKFFFLIEVKFTYHKINHFQGDNPVTFSPFTLQPPPLYLVPKRCHHPKRNPLPLPQPLATTNLLSVSEDLLMLTLHIKGIAPHVTFHVCLLSLRVMLSRLIHVVFPNFLLFDNVSEAPASGRHSTYFISFYLHTDPKRYHVIPI